MAPFPTFQQYNEALKNPAAAFVDAELKAGTIKTNLHGQPMPFAGGLALAYKIGCGPNKYAVRCFRKDVEALRTRYWAIEKRLRGLNSPYFVDFALQDPGIVVDGQKFPIVKMAWAAGTNIASFLASNHENPEALEKIDAALFDLAQFLEDNRIGHGNIEPGNLLVAPSGLKLIDYDSMYLDEISALGSRERGLRNFQHPERAVESWGPDMDRFSLLLLHVAIGILKREPGEWRASQSDRDAIIFTANDLANPSRSPVFRRLEANPRLAGLVSAFRQVCEGAFAAVPSLKDFDARNISVQAPGAGRPGGYIGNYAVLSGADYDGCLAHVGETVELVGRVQDVKLGFTKRGKPYYFVNFADWRGNAVKLTAWPKALKKSKIAFDSLPGKFVTATGLLEPPYVTNSYSHISLSLSETTPFREITAGEAAWRLAPPAPAAQDPHPGRRLYPRLEKKPRAKPQSAPQPTPPLPPRNKSSHGKYFLVLGIIAAVALAIFLLGGR